MFRQSGHRPIMAAPENPHNNGFRCGNCTFISTDTSEPTASQTGLDIADDDLNWWSWFENGRNFGGGGKEVGCPGLLNYLSGAFPDKVRDPALRAAGAPPYSVHRRGASNGLQAIIVQRQPVAPL